MTLDDGSRRRRLISTTVGITLGGTAYLLTLLDWSLDLTRTANSLGYASNFFDYQARAFLDGDVHVPNGSLGIEGFRRDGLEYMYFQPFPALLRIPVLLLTREYDGKLTLLSMGLAFVLMAVMTSRLVWLVRDLMRPDAPTSRTEAVATTILLAAVLGGTSWTFNASLPWVYHEVYAWAVPFVVGSMYWMLRVLRAPTNQAIAWLAVFCLGAILTRTTGGWAVCLVTIGVGVWFATGRLRSLTRARWAAVVAAGAAPLLVGIAYNMFKFGHPYLFPLEDQVWTELNTHRQEALEVNGGTITGPQFFPTALMAYFRLDGVRLVEHFPFITFPAEPARAYAGAFIDQSYRTGSVTAFMPLPLVLCVTALVVLFRPGAPRGHRMLRVPFLAGVLVTGGVMAYGYIAYRYTCEFVPALVLGGAVGTVAVSGWLERRSGWLTGAALATTSVVAAYSVAAQMLTGTTAAAVTAGGDRLVRHLELQERLSADAQQRLVSTSPTLPRGGRTDQLHIEGDCDSLWLNTGDAYEPWVLVERRSQVLVATIDPDVRRTDTLLATLDTHAERSVHLETSADGQARVYLRHEKGRYYGPWFDVTPPGVVRIGIRDHAGLGYAEVSSTPGGWAGYLRSFEWDGDWVSRPVQIRLEPDDRDASDGVVVRAQPGIVPPLCARLLDRSGTAS